MTNIVLIVLVAAIAVAIVVPVTSGGQSSNSDGGSGFGSLHNDFEQEIEALRDQLQTVASTSETDFTPHTLRYAEETRNAIDNLTVEIQSHQKRKLVTQKFAHEKTSKLRSMSKQAYQTISEHLNNTALANTYSKYTNLADSLSTEVQANSTNIISLSTYLVNLETHDIDPLKLSNTSTNQNVSILQQGLQQVSAQVSTLSLTTNTISTLTHDNAVQTGVTQQQVGNHLAQTSTQQLVIETLSTNLGTNQQGQEWL